MIKGVYILQKNRRVQSTYPPWFEGTVSVNMNLLTHILEHYVCRMEGLFCFFETSRWHGWAIYACPVCVLSFVLGFDQETWLSLLLYCVGNGSGFLARFFSVNAPFGRKNKFRNSNRIDWSRTRSRQKKNTHDQKQTWSEVMKESFHNRRKGETQ